MPPAVLTETARLRFRPHQSSDQDSFVAAQMDAEFRRYLGGRPRTREDATRRFKNNLRRTPRGPLGMWALASRDDDTYVGYCTLRRESDGVHLGYCIVRSCWRRGFGYEAAHGLVEIARTHNLMPLHAEVEQGNVASEKILQRLGFAPVREEYLAHSGRTLIHFKLASGAHGLDTEKAS